MSFSTIRFCLIAVAALTGLCGCSGGRQYRSAQGLTWGTQYHVTYLSDTDLSDSIVAVMRRIDLSLSPFCEGSLVQRLNSGEEVVSDTMLARVVDISKWACALSHGAFDPTVAPLVNLWGFGYRKGDGEAPSQLQIDSALCTVGILECHAAAGELVRKKHPATEFNFSAVAKGYGVDCIADMLRRNGCTDYMVEVGGEIALSGNGPRGDRWSIQIDAPVDDVSGSVHERLRVIRTTGVGIATSGNYRNYRLTPQGRVGHTISPVTGLPVVSDVLSATVIAPTCAQADALATTVMALPAGRGIAIVDSLPEVEALIVLADTIVATRGWTDGL